jgi:hypothetical protein
MKQIVIVALIALLVAACGEGITRSTDPQPLSETTTTLGVGQLEALMAARAQWEEAAPDDYTLTQRDRCDECSGEPTTVAVRDGEVVSLASPETETIDELFSAIEESIRGGAEVEVEYDEGLGYPTRVMIDLDGDGEADVDLEYDGLEAMPIVETLEELLTAKQRWEAQALDSYRYIFRADCTCPDGGTFDVEVHDGRVTALRPLDALAELSDLSPGAIDAAFTDLEQWFTDSDTLIADGLLAVDVRMDPNYGYPRWFRVEARDIDDGNFAGDFTITVTLDLIGAIDPVPVDPEVDPPTDELATLDEARSRWADASITDYEFVVTVHCECPDEERGPFRITVSNGEPVAAHRTTDGSDAAEHAATIDDVFDAIALSIGAEIEVAVTYDAQFGYPVDVVIDVPAVAVDGGSAFTISEFSASR